MFHNLSCNYVDIHRWRVEGAAVARCSMPERLVRTRGLSSRHAFQADAMAAWRHLQNIRAKARAALEMWMEMQHGHLRSRRCLLWATSLLRWGSGCKALPAGVPKLIIDFLEDDVLYIHMPHVLLCPSEDLSVSFNNKAIRMRLMNELIDASNILVEVVIFLESQREREARLGRATLALSTALQQPLWVVQECVSSHLRMRWAISDVYGHESSDTEPDADHL